MTEIQYISDSKGHPVGVIVPIEIWNKIESVERKPRVAELKDLFKKTQSLPQIKPITDAEIMLEIEAYRSGK
jgi:hypothetical protein